MRYLRIIDGVINYPYTLNQLYKDNPNTSFKVNMTEADLADWGMYKVNTIAKPNDYTKNIYEGTPQLVDGQYFQNWIQEDGNQEQIDDKLLLKWLQIKEHRNELLKECDWTQLPDSPITGSKLTEWQTYRQELRDLTTNENPFTLIWPSQPE